MRCWGFRQVRLTGCGRDGGIDVESAEAVAQVKAWMVPIGSPAVQQLKGVAYDGRTPIFFSLMDYTPAAITFADKAEVALFRFTGYDGVVEPVNSHARRVLAAFDKDCRKQNGSDDDSELCNHPIFNVVADSLSKVLKERKGIGIFTVRENDRFVQYSWEKDKGIRAKVSESSNYTSHEQAVLEELGWQHSRDEHGSCYYLDYPTPPLPIDQIVRLMTKTLIDMNGAWRLNDIEVTIEIENKYGVGEVFKDWANRC